MRVRTVLLRNWAMGSEAVSELGLRGAGDENRTRTISLGSSAVTAARGADQVSLAVPSDVTDPSSPWLMAR